MSHPSSIDLEAFACGEELPVVSEHLTGCDACEAHVARLREAVAGGPSESAVRAMVASAEARLPAASDGAPSAPPRLRVILRASTVAAPLALAAMIFLLVRTGPSTSEGVAYDRPEAPATEAPSVPALPATDPEVAFKGGVQIAVIRE